MNKDDAIGLAWYRPEQWALLYSASTDKDVLEDSHAEWERMAIKSLSDMRRDGLNIRKVDIDVEELIAWCKSTGKPLDGKARSEFTAMTLRDADNQ